MGWTVEFHPDAVRDLRKLDSVPRKRIVSFLRERVAAGETPRHLGSALRGPLGELWKYRVGDYRVLCSFQDKRLVVLVVRIGHRSRVYDE